MRLVQHATVRPFHCAVLPQIGNSNSLGFVDSGSDLDLEHVYVSFEAIFEMARMIGWHPPAVVRQLHSDIASKDARIEQLEGEVREADKFSESAKYTLAKFGTEVQRKPGRPKNTTTKVG